MVRGEGRSGPVALEEAVGCGRRGGGPGAPARPLKGTAASLGAGGCRLAPGTPVRFYFIPRCWGCRGEPLPACRPVPVYLLGLQTNYCVPPGLVGLRAGRQRLVSAGRSRARNKASHAGEHVVGAGSMAGSLLPLLRGSDKTCLPGVMLAFAGPLGRGGWAASHGV